MAFPFKTKNCWSTEISAVVWQKCHWFGAKDSVLSGLSCANKMLPFSGSYEGEMSSWKRQYFANYKIQCQQNLK